MSETWIPVPDTDGQYEVSDHGRVRSLKAAEPRVLRSLTNRSGHQRLDVRINGRRLPRYVHRLVLEAFIGHCPDGHEVRHLDGDPANNRLDNLAYGTRSENVLDSIRHGRHNQSSKTHCPHGHPLSGENLYMARPDAQRRCRTCRRRHTHLRPAITARVNELKAAE